MNRIKVVAFDCDGVMFDTTDANTAYYNQILNAMEMPLLTRAQFEYVHMHTVDSALSFLFKDAEILKKAHAYRKNMGYHPFIKEMKEEPGLKQLIAKLKPRFKTAVATNRSDTMDAVLKTFDLEHCFDLVVTALDVDHPKPHPESLEKIISHFHAKPDEVLYIGDSELDEKAAAAAGVALIAYQNPNLAGKYHISSLSEIDHILHL